MTIKKILKKYKLTITEASRRLNIPVRTLENWSCGARVPPQYVIELIEYKLQNDKEATK